MGTRAGLGFATADAAAIAALDEINPISIAKKWEYAGRLYQREGFFFFTRATTLESPNDSQAGPAVSTNVGTYHTHAGAFMPTDEQFSPQDKLKATLSKELAYLGTPYQRILRFTPVDLLSKVQQRSYPLGKVDVLRNLHVLPETTIRWR